MYTTYLPTDYVVLTHYLQCYTPYLTTCKPTLPPFHFLQYEYKENFEPFTSDVRLSVRSLYNVVVFIQP